MILLRPAAAAAVLYIYKRVSFASSTCKIIASRSSSDKKKVAYHFNKTTTTTPKPNASHPTFNSTTVIQLYISSAFTFTIIAWWRTIIHSDYLARQSKGPGPFAPAVAAACSDLTRGEAIYFFQPYCLTNFQSQQTTQNFISPAAPHAKPKPSASCFLSVAYLCAAHPPSSPSPSLDTHLHIHSLHWSPVAVCLDTTLSPLNEGSVCPVDGRHDHSATRRSRTRAEDTARSII